MTSDEQEYDIAEIHKLLMAAFTVKSLRRFCYQRPAFRPILDEFSPDHGLADMADRVVEYCEKYVLLDELLSEVQRANSRQYTRFSGPDLPSGEAEEPRPERAPEAPGAPEPAASDLLTITHPIALDLVRVPAGAFRMGSDLSEDADAEDDELPPHYAYVPEFYIGKYPVTNMQYLHLVKVTGHGAPKYWKGGRMPRPEASHPVTNLSWEDALVFCDWLSQRRSFFFWLASCVCWLPGNGSGESGGCFRQALVIESIGRWPKEKEGNPCAGRWC